MSSDEAVVVAIDELVAEFASVQGSDRLELLIECGADLPGLRPAFADAPELGERVEECQSPVVLYALVSDDETSHAVDITVPESAPVTRGFAALVQQLADGRSASEILDIPTDLTAALGLNHLVSPLRLAGMQVLIARLQRRVRASVLM